MRIWSGASALCSRRYVAGPPVRGHRSRRARTGDRVMPGQLAPRPVPPRRQGTNAPPADQSSGRGRDQRRSRRRHARSRSDGRQPTEREVGAPGSGAARQIVGWHADRIPPHHSVPRRPGHRLMDASFGLARLVSCRPWHPPPGAGRSQGPLVLNLAGTLAVTTAMAASSTSEDQREPCASAAHRRAPARSGRKSARVRVLGPLTPRPASGRLATARRPASWWTTERRVTCSRARGAAMRPST